MSMTPSIGITLDRQSDEPFYRQLFNQVVARIHSGTLPAGFRLPPTRALAQSLGTHRNTVVRAYADLEAAGFVTSATGKGTFVAAGPPDRPAPPPPAGGAMPWPTLLARVLGAEPLDRFERLARHVGGRGLINLSRMQPSEDLIPDEMLRRCADHVLRTQGARALGYAPPEGLPRLRELIREHLLRQGVPARTEDIIVTTGSQQAIDLVARALVNPGDVMLVDPATYTGAIKLLTLAGAHLVPVPSDDEGPEMAALARLGRPGVKGFYLIPNSHNPTGMSVSLARRQQIVEWSRRTGVPLIEDDYGADLYLGREPPPPALRTLDGDVIYLGTFSKRLAPALRIGFVLCPRVLQPVLLTMKHALDLGSSALLQHVLAEFLDRGYLRAHLGRSLPEYRARRDALVEALRAELPAGLRFRVPEHGVVLWLPLPERLSPEQCFEEAQRRGVLIGPSGLYAVDAQQVRGVRMTYCAEPADRVAEGGRRVGEALRALWRQARRGSGEEAEQLGAV